MTERVFRGRIPTVRAMVERLDWLDKVGDPAAVAKTARKIMETERRQAEAMRKLDRIFRTHGVEYIEGVGDYLNTGDSYGPTIIAHNGDYVLGTWADAVEAVEKRSKRGRRGHASFEENLAAVRASTEGPRAFAQMIAHAYQSMPPGADRQYFIDGVFADMEAGVRADFVTREHVRARFPTWRRTDYKAAIRFISDALGRR